MVAKTEKIGWFDRKLNKWVKLFEESQETAGTRHNDVVEKINEVDSSLRKEVSKLTKAQTRILEKVAKGGLDKTSPRDASLEDGL